MTVQAIKKTVDDDSGQPCLLSFLSVIALLKLNAVCARFSVSAFGVLMKSCTNSTCRFPRCNTPTPSGRVHPFLAVCVICTAVGPSTALIYLVRRTRVFFLRLNIYFVGKTKVRRLTAVSASYFSCALQKSQI